MVATLLRKQVIKKSLLTRDVSTARDLALALWRAYDEFHQHVRIVLMAGKTKDIQLLIERLKKEGRHYRLVHKPDGTIEVEAQGAEDHALAREMIESIGVMKREALVQEWMKAGWDVNASNASPTPLPTAPVAARAMPAPPAAAPSSQAPEAVMPLGKAITQWLADIKNETVAKTQVSKRLALEDFARTVGETTLVHECTRVPVGRWVSELRAREFATPTVVNRLSYLRGFLTWARGKGQGLHQIRRPQQSGVGPSVLRCTRKTPAEKAWVPSVQRRPAQTPLCAGRNHEAQPGHPAGVWMGLFTGARVSEVGRLALSDFFDVDGIPCLRITDEGVGQSTKHEASNRIIPVHPESIRMGLMKRVERLRAAGEKRLFPKSGRCAPKSGAAINGQGDWLSKAFGRHLSAILPKPDTGKLGFHSFRKTLILHLQAQGVEAERRAAYVGHDLDDEHHNTYSDDVPKQQILDAIQKLVFPVAPETDAFA